MCWTLELLWYLHSKSTLHYSQDSRIRSTKAGEVLKVAKDEACRLLIIVASDYGDDHHEERRDVPDQNKSRQIIEYLGQENVRKHGHKSDEICHQYRMPTFDYVLGMREICHTKDEVCLMNDQF